MAEVHGAFYSAGRVFHLKHRLPHVNVNHNLKVTEMGLLEGWPVRSCLPPATQVTLQL